MIEGLLLSMFHKLGNQDALLTHLMSSVGGLAVQLRAGVFA